MIYTVTLNPALDKTAEIPNMALDTVNRVAALRTDPGGKGINVSKVIKALGGESVTLALLAGHCGHVVAEACRALGLACGFTFTAGETRTNLKIVDPALHTNTDVNEPGITVDGGVLDGMLEGLLRSLKPGDIVVLSGSLPTGAPTNLYRTWTLACRKKGAKVFLDADGEALRCALEAGPCLVKPNLDELERLTGRALKRLEDIAAAGGTLLTGGTERVVVSLGGDGAMFLSRGRSLYAPGLQVRVGSTVGAGDAMVAALALAEDRGLDREETVRLAMAASAASVMCSGTQAPEPEAVLALKPRVSVESLDKSERPGGPSSGDAGTGEGI